MNCPAKSLGPKGFERGKHGHIALKCPEKARRRFSQMERKKYTKTVSMGDRIIIALIDTGSDTSIIRDSEYVMVGSPRLRASAVEFCGVGGYRALASGEFPIQIIIDGCIYPILIRVVPDTVLLYGCYLTVRIF